MTNYDRALEMATRAHAGQIDKAGADYIEHPKRVAAQFSDETLQVIALLHDVIEDTEVTREEIAGEFGEEIAAEIDALSRCDSESYEEFIERAAMRPLARQVKIADLRDNMNLSRLPEITNRDRER